MNPEDRAYLDGVKARVMARTEVQVSVYSREEGRHVKWMVPVPPERPNCPECGRWMSFGQRGVTRDWQPVMSWRCSGSKCWVNIYTTELQWCNTAEWHELRRYMHEFKTLPSEWEGMPFDWLEELALQPRLL